MTWLLVLLLVNAEGSKDVKHLSVHGTMMACQAEKLKQARTYGRDVLECRSDVFGRFG